MTSGPDAAATPGEITLGGKAYRMSPLTREDRAEFDRWLQQRVIAAARAGITPDMPADERREWMDSAIRVAQHVSMETREGIEHFGTVQGVARLLWIGVRRHHPELTVDKVVEMLDEASIDASIDVWNLLNGPGQKKRAKPGPPPEPPTTAHSTGPSPGPTGGAPSR